MVVISAYIYGVKIIKKFRWESGFLWGVPWNPPLCTNGSAGYLMQLSVNSSQPFHRLVDYFKQLQPLLFLISW